MMNTDNLPNPTRRELLKAGAAAAAAGAFGAPMILSSATRAAGAVRPDQIKIGLVGCGGRGSGAALQALNAGNDIVLISMGDVLQSQIDNSLANLRKESNVADRIKVDPDHCFVGLDAYQKVIDSGVDVVLLATPPGFRPLHIKAAVDANKHVFAEKPVATDAVGVRTALAATRLAAQKKLSFVAGFCWRYDPARQEFYKRVLDGQIGDIRHIHATYLTSPVKPMPPASSRPAGMSDVEWQIRNWYNFVWTCGDGLIEQACHSIDKILWGMKDVPPARAVATGGRVLPNNEGNIYDHIDVFYEWPDGTRASMAQRQIPVPFNDNSDFLTGSKGQGVIKGFGRPELSGATNWRFEGKDKNMYQVEHDVLFASIRNGSPVNDGERMCRSTLAGLMGRMAAYTGDEITWEQMQTSQEKLVPDHLDWNGSLPIAPMAIPGRTKFV